MKSREERESRGAVMEGSRAVAKAVALCRPGVISAYPITPQTHIVEELARMVADGELAAEYLRVDSEFSAASAVYGAAATGVRAYTASSSQGLLLMTEVLYNMAGTRLPVVIGAANRTLSAPISIQPDQQDTISLRDSGLIQLYVEDSQEAHDAHIQAFRIAEDPEVLLPVMVCMDGWLITHTFEPVRVASQEAVDSFLPPFKLPYSLDPTCPFTFGSFTDDDKLMEFRYMVHQAQQKAKEKIEQVARAFEESFGRYYGDVIDSYSAEDADVLLLAMGSVVGTIKDAIDRLREEGQKVGLIKVRAYRPFPAERIREATKGAKVVAVLDNNISLGAYGALGADVALCLANQTGAPALLPCIVGLGGREITIDSIRSIVNRALAVVESKTAPEDSFWVDLQPELI
jgi:pyruvate ferredoxin oxidoreductase alpha subunit